MFILSISENILLFIAGIGIVQGIFLAALLFFYPKSDWTVNRFLAFHIVGLTFPVVMPIIQQFFSWQTMILIEPFLALIWPLFYFYIRSFKEVITWKKAWPHFILFVLFIPLAVWDYNVIGSQYPASSEVPSDISRYPLFFLPIGVRLIQRIVYYFLSRRALQFYQRSILHVFSDTSRINLNWIRWLVNGNLGLIFLTIVMYPLLINFPEYFDWLILIPAAIVSLYIYVAAIKAISQPTLWQLRPELSQVKAEEVMEEAEKIELEYAEKEKVRSRKAGLNDDQIGVIVNRIISVMESEKIYQEPELTMQQLAAKLQLAPHQLSHAINEGLKKNFYDLVNGYRVAEAKRLLLDPRNKNYTILSVGFEVGFNSKTTFNTVFKKFTGLTPTEYRHEPDLSVLG